MRSLSAVAWRQIMFVSLSTRALAGQSPSRVPGATAAPSFTLPTPAGRDLIGTSRMVIGAATSRPLVVTMWYPAARRAVSTPVAPYLREEAALRTMADWGGNPGPMLLRNAGVVTHAHLDAPIARGALPVVIFSHGYLDQPSSYTALMEELASRGYAVFSVAHTGETMAVTLPNGSISSIFKTTGGLQPIPASVSGEWSAEDSVAKAITTAPSAVIAEATLRAYLDRIPNSTATVERWVADMGEVTTELARLNRSNSGSRFARRLNLGRFTAVGHSMGGVVSAAFCARDARCRGAINLDGSPQYGDLIDRPSRTPMLMVYGSRPGRVGVSDIVYDKGAAHWRAVVDGAMHLNFGDWMYWPAGVLDSSSIGPLGASASTTIVHRLVREFLDMTLARGPAPLFTGEATMPSLTITRRSRSARE